MIVRPIDRTAELSFTLQSSLYKILAEIRGDP